MNIVVAHIGSSADGQNSLQHHFHLPTVGEVEHHHIYIFLIPNDVKTLFVRCLDKTVISINQLNKLSFCHIQSLVAGSADTVVLLAYIDDVILILHQVIDGTLVGSVIYHDNLTLEGAQGELQNAFNTLL